MYSDEAALEDVLRLSRAMTYKSAVARTGLGGGKSVVVADPADKSEELFEAMGRFVGDFGGSYITAEDVNVGIPDLRFVVLHRVWPLPSRRAAVATREATVRWAAPRRRLREATGSAELEGRTVAVQGLGAEPPRGTCRKREGASSSRR